MTEDRDYMYNAVVVHGQQPELPEDLRGTLWQAPASDIAGTFTTYLVVELPQGLVGPYYMLVNLNFGHVVLRYVSRESLLEWFEGACARWLSQGKVEIHPHRHCVDRGKEEGDE